MTLHIGGPPRITLSRGKPKAEVRFVNRYVPRPYVPARAVAFMVAETAALVAVLLVWSPW